jgi:hypothetical protein
MWLFFGCRQRALDLYREEKARMLEEGVLDKVYLALSREPTIPKVTSVRTQAQVNMGHYLHTPLHLHGVDLEYRISGYGCIHEKSWL